VREQRALVFPWVDGTALYGLVDERKPDLLRRAAALAADLHRIRRPRPDAHARDGGARDPRSLSRAALPLAVAGATMRPLQFLVERAGTELDPAPRP
jgi:hypothetical protein